MILLDKPAGGAVLLIGRGLLGGAIVEQLQRSGCEVATTLPVPWEDCPELCRRLEEMLSQAGHRGGGLDVIWSAGHCGFAATQPQCDEELANYSAALKVLVREVGQRVSRFRFHLLSSAGGLFEGQTAVNADTSPCPRRPYGELKLTQERLARDCFGARSSIYRVATVYSAPRDGCRRGLVAALIENMRQDRETTITGGMNTLRDFVYLEDVARFIAHSLLTGCESGDELHWLVSAKPSSILEVISILENRLQRRVLLQYRGDRSNAADISFVPRLQSAGWRGCNLYTGLGLCALGY